VQEISPCAARPEEDLGRLIADTPGAARRAMAAPPGATHAGEDGWQSVFFAIQFISCARRRGAAPLPIMTRRAWRWGARSHSRQGGTPTMW